MTQTLLSGSFCAGFFPNVSKAEKAIADLMAAGFTKDQLGIVCPKQFRHEFTKEFPQEQTPASSSPARVAEGASVGAALGGVALIASAIATGGASLVPGAMVLIGGGAIAGGISNMIVSDGYRGGINEYFAHAHDRGEILIGVYLEGEATRRYADAAAILRNAGATSIVPNDDPTT